MKCDAEFYFSEACCALIRSTKTLLLNDIYDMEPLRQFSYKKIVLVGDAAHPIRFSTLVYLRELTVAVHTPELGLTLRWLTHETCIRVWQNLLRVVTPAVWKML